MNKNKTRTKTRCGGGEAEDENKENVVEYDEDGKWEARNLFFHDFRSVSFIFYNRSPFKLQEKREKEDAEEENRKKENDMRRRCR